MSSSAPRVVILGGGVGTLARSDVSQSFALPALTTARTVHVDANPTAGNDNNTGNAEFPFRTLARAIADRQSYGDLQAPYTIQLHGPGPFTWPGLVGSLCSGPNGSFTILGDPAAQTTHYTGTFTGDFAGMVVPTSAGLGADPAQRGRWCRIKTGNCAGAIFLIAENTDASLTPVVKTFRNVMGVIANGDQFEVFTPGSEVAHVSGANQYFALIGGVALFPRHFFRELRMTGVQVQVGAGSRAAFYACKFEAGLFNSENASLASYKFDLVPAVSAPLSSVGITVSSFNFQSYSTTTGPMVCETFGNVGSYATWNPLGGRFVQDIAVGTYGFLQMSGTGSATAYFNFQAFLDILDGGRMVISGNAGIAKFATTAGSCVRVRRGGDVLWRPFGVAWTGGTTDAAGFGVTVLGGGRCVFSGVGPTLTGGTAGKDLQTTANAAGVANATLNATGTTVDALGSPYAETLSRVA